MSILNVQIDSIGQSGVSPTFIYLQTNDSVAMVTAVGYLNQLIAEGFLLSESQVAVVSTQATPSSQQVQTNLYSLYYASGQWSLVPLGGSGGGSFYSISGNSNLSGSSFLGSLNAEPLNIGTDSIPVIVVGANQDVTVTSPLVNLDVTGGNLELEGLGLGTGPNILFYNTGTGYVTYGAASAAGDFWNLHGTNSGAGNLLGTSSANGYSFVVSGVTYYTVDPAANVSWVVPTFAITASTSITLGSAEVLLPNITAATQSNILYYNSSNGQVYYDTAPVVAPAWLLGGNTLASAEFLGSNNAFGVNIGTDGVNAITISSSQAITMPALTVAPGGQKILMVDPTTYQLYISP